MLRILRRSGGVFSIIVLALLVITAVVSLWWTPANPNAASAADLWAPPSADHLLGADGSGRDIASRLMAGGWVTLVVILGVGALAALIGLSLGILGGLGPPRLQQAIAVVVDVFVAFPTILLAMMLAAVFGGGIPVVIVSLGLAFGVTIGRVLRPEFQQAASADYVFAARSFGLGAWLVFRRHIFPTVRPVFIVQLSLSLGLAVLAESSLSYLGFGAPVGTPSWGRMLAESQRTIGVHPETALWPGLAVTLVAAACFFLGDTLRDVLDSSSRRRVPGAPRLGTARTTDRGGASGVMLG